MDTEPQVILIGVVKDYGYGHRLVQIAKFLTYFCGYSTFTVDKIDKAIAFRRSLNTGFYATMVKPAVCVWGRSIQGRGDGTETSHPTTAISCSHDVLQPFFLEAN